MNARPSQQLRGFTLVELMIVVTIISVLASIAIPGFQKYIRKARYTEGLLNLRKLFDASVTYYQSEHGTSGGVVASKQFAPQAAAWAPPLGTCCTAGNYKCAASGSYWVPDAPTWQTLNFQVTDPSVFYYKVTWNVGDGSKGGDTEFVEAQADTNCNGIYYYARRSLTVDANLNNSGSAAIYSKNEGE